MFKNFLVIFIIIFSLTDFTQAAISLGQKLAGLILLNVDLNGEAWYVYPVNFKRYYLGKPKDAFNVMKTLGLGAKHDFIEGQEIFPKHVLGKILLDVEYNGQAYYIYPKDRKKYFLGRPEDAYKVRRKLSLGITNENLEKIATVDTDLEKDVVIIIKPPKLILPKDLTYSAEHNMKFSWSASPELTTFDFQLADDQAFTNPLVDLSDVTVKDSTLNQSIKDLKLNQVYYWRVRGKTDSDTTDWSEVFSFKHFHDKIVCKYYKVTYSGQSYDTIGIKNQCWLKQNLNLGQMVKLPAKQSRDGVIEKYCYDNKTGECANNGGLYTWTEIMKLPTICNKSNINECERSNNKIQGICPIGWHIPSDKEWSNLEGSLRKSNNSCVANRDNLWDCANSGTAIKLEIGCDVCNSSGFSAPIAGYIDEAGNSVNKDKFAFYWTSTSDDPTKAWSREIGSSRWVDYAGISRNNSNKNSAFYVRCLQD